MSGKRTVWMHWSFAVRWLVSCRRVGFRFRWRRCGGMQKGRAASNADYWYERAGRRFQRASFEAEWEALVEGLSGK